MFMKEISSDGDVSTVSELSMHGIFAILVIFMTLYFYPWPMCLSLILRPMHVHVYYLHCVT